MSESASFAKTTEKRAPKKNVTVSAWLYYLAIAAAAVTVSAGGAPLGGEREHDSMPNPHVILPSRILIAATSDSEPDVEPSQIVTFK